MKQTKLFCFPHAGGSASGYYKWRKKLAAGIELIPIELAGRGTRFNHPFYEAWEQAVEDLFGQVRKHLDGSPIALFGYSMGSLFAFELAYRILEWTGEEPRHLFFAAKSAPQRPKKTANLHHLDTDDFIHEIARLGGTPKEILQNTEFIDVFLPILRADFAIIETYEYRPKQNKLTSPFSVLSGLDDLLAHDDLIAWAQHTSGHTTIDFFAGDHFFIHNNTEQIIQLINQKLMAMPASLAR